MKRVVWCPGPQKWISIGQLANIAKIARAHMDTEFPRGITQWWPVTGAEIMKDFRAGWMDRCNQGIPAYLRGQKS